MLGKDINIYVKYAGDWYLPPEERDIAATLINQYDVDVLTQQTDSGSPLDVAQKKASGSSVKIWTSSASMAGPIPIPLPFL